MKLLWILLPVTLGACGSIVSLDGRPCPCSTGYFCHEGICEAEPTGSGSGNSTGFAITPDAAPEPEASDGHVVTRSGTDAGGTDDGSSAPSGENAYCYYASGGQGGDCSYENDTPDVAYFDCDCTGSQGNKATAAQTALDCMAGKGSIVSACPSEGLVGCCTSSYGSFGGLASYTEGNTVACSYGADMEDELHCLANGGNWSKVAPR